MTDHYKHEIMQTAALIPYARNARKHSAQQIDKLVNAIREWGFTNPILIDEDGNIIAGHGRVMAAKQMSMETVPTIRVAGLTPEQRRALVLADNRLALDATWDETLLREELDELQKLGVNLEGIGFNEDELANYLNRTHGRTDPDDAPEAPLHPISRDGDVWLLGRHRLVCGSSLDPDVVANALHGIVPNLMVTDPPYGVSYDASWRSKKLEDGAQRAEGKVEHDDRADWTPVWRMFPGDIAYVWHSGLKAHVVGDSLEQAGYEVRAQVIWSKNKHALSRGHYHWQHEACWYVVRAGKTGGWMGDRSQTTIWKIESEKLDTGHSTQKPVECMKRPIENNSSPGQAVFEPFSGSGTTIIAAEMSGRNCHAIELNPAYIDVAVWRWMRFTGADARHEETGLDIYELAKAREVEIPVAMLKVKEAK